MKALIRILSILTACFLLLLSGCGLWTGIAYNRAYMIPALTAADLDALDLSGADKLMIVAHPDDETLWGGGHLSQGGYFVVCITNGKNQTRASEFQSVMAASGNTGLLLSYPDKVAGRRDDWEQVWDNIAADLQLILTYRSWSQITTHNADGEYGHQHHRMTHSLVTEQYDTLGLKQPLYVFGTYYKASLLPEVSNTLTPLTENMLTKKEQLLTLYTSQKRTVKKLSHMNPYEEWEKIRGGNYENA